jgi:UDP:flavonoid glycosyltransferase YjiC (YdhE family)
MARILVATLPFAGHVGATAAVTAELTRRGHEVVAYTGAKYAGRFEAAGATWLPRTRATDFDDADLAATFPEIGDGKGFRADRANGELILFGTAAGQAEDILAEAARQPFDLLVVDQTAFGGALAGEKLGVPWATIPVTPLSRTAAGAGYWRACRPACRWWWPGRRSTSPRWRGGSPGPAPGSTCGPEARARPR